MVWFLAPIMLRKLYYGFQDRLSWWIFKTWSSNLAILWGYYGDIPNQSDAGVFKVRISLVWHQFQLELDKVNGRRLGAACLVNFLDSLTVRREKTSQNDASNSSEWPNQYNTGLSWHFVWSFIELFALKLYCRANRNRLRVFTLLQNDNNNTNRGWLACGYMCVAKEYICRDVGDLVRSPTSDTYNLPLQQRRFRLRQLRYK